MLLPPPPDDPLALLEACHRKLESRLDALAAVAERLAAGRDLAKAAEAIAAAVKHFDGPGRWHLQDEELSLLPRLPGVSLHADHAAIEAGWAALKPVLLGLQQAPGDAGLLARLQELLPPFAELHRRHHAEEERDVLALARERLSAGQLAEIAAEMRARREG